MSFVPSSSRPVGREPELRDKALGLRESAHSSRARLLAQREQIERLRAELAALRALVAEAPAAAPVRAPAPSAVPARAASPARAVLPVVPEASADSAPAGASGTAGTRGGRFGALPYAAILAAAAALQFHPFAKPAPGLPLTAAAPVAPKPVPVTASLTPTLEESDDEGRALLLAHDWVLPGDRETLADRLGPETGLPGARPAWTAERTGERVFRVTFQSDENSPAYEFDVDLDSRRVDPSPDTVALLEPLLTARR